LFSISFFFFFEGMISISLEGINGGIYYNRQDSCNQREAFTQSVSTPWPEYLTNLDTTDKNQLPSVMHPYGFRDLSLFSLLYLSSWCILTNNNWNHAMYPSPSHSLITNGPQKACWFNSSFWSVHIDRSQLYPIILMPP